MELRGYQERDVARIRAAYAAGKRSVLYVLPTGGGKTFTFAYITKSAADKGNRTGITVHRRELLNQASRSLSALGVDHGLVRPGFNGERNQVAVASIQTLDRRLKKTQIDFDLMIVDEAHHTGAASWERVLSHFPTARILGVTATPIRLDGRGLGIDSGGMFDEMIVGPSITELINGGFLVPPEVYAYPSGVDLSGVKKIAGDYSLKEVSSRVDRPTITGCAIEHYAKLSPGDPAIAFCATLDHAQHVTNDFRRAGYNSEVIHGGLPEDQRQEMIDGLASGKIHVLTSKDLISEGTDIPIVSTAILLRPTESLSLYLQQVGRILRPAAGKKRGLVLDHVGNCLKHGLPDEDREWSLSGEKRKPGSGDGLFPFVRQCKSCFAVWERGIKCPYCGNTNVKVESRQPKAREGELEKIDKEKIKRFKQEKRAAYARCESYQEVLDLTKKFGDKPGFAFMYWNAKENKKRTGG